MDIKKLLEQLAETSDLNKDAMNAMTQPSLLRAQKQQQMPNLPKEDLSNLMQDIHENKYDDQVEEFMNKNGDMVTGMVNPMQMSKPLVQTVGNSRFGKLLEGGLDSLRDTKIGDTSVGQFLEKNVRQPIKTVINENMFGKMDEATKLEQRIVNGKKYIDDMKFDRDTMPGLRKQQDEALKFRNSEQAEALELANLNKNYDSGVPSSLDEITKKLGEEDKTKVIEEITKTRKIK